MDGEGVSEEMRMRDGSAMAASNVKPWYRYWRFPLLPEFYNRAPDRWNMRDLGVTWLCFSAWTLTSPELGIEVGLDDQVAYARVRLPYLQIWVKLPIFPRALTQKTWRTTSRWREIKMHGDNVSLWSRGHTIAVDGALWRVMATWDGGISVARPWWWRLGRLVRRRRVERAA